MIRGAWAAEHESIEPVVILEAVKNFEPKTVAIERNQRVKIVGRTGDAQRCNFAHEPSL